MLNWLRRFRDRDRVLDKELRFHFESLVEDYVRQGMSEADARRRATLEFGGIAQNAEECRDVRRGIGLETLMQDTAFALRGLRRNPRFALSAIAAVAVAVGAATAVFSVADRSLFRPLPYAHHSRLVSVGIVAPVIHTQDWIFAGVYQEWKGVQSIFESISAWRGVSDCDRNDGASERLSCAAAEASFLPTLGVTPLLGRNFNEQEDRPGAEPVALLSFSYWQSRLGADPNILNQRLTVDGASTRIIGVLPADFETPTLAAADLLVPLKMRYGSERQKIVHVIGRMPEGMSARQAALKIEPAFAQFVQTSPGDFRKAVKMQLRVATLRDQQVREYRLALWMLLGAVLCFVAIACANVAHLLLARAAQRRQEFAVRASLGASRARLVLQSMTESGVLGIAGGACGIFIAFALLRAFQSLAPQGALRMQQASLDPRVLVFAFAVSLLSALLFGVAPAVENLRAEAFSAARVIGRSRSRLRPALISVQLSVSMVLLTATGLFLLSLDRLQQAKLGFTTQSVVTASFLLPEARYRGNEQQIAFFQDLERRLSEVPGFVSAAITDSLPPGGDPRSRPFVALVGGGDTHAKGMEGTVKWRYVTAGYFRTLGIPIRRGRGFLPEDRNGAIVLSESLARRLYGDADPSGRLLKLEETFEVVGVAADVRNAGLAATDPEFYVLRAAQPTPVYRNQRPPYGWRRAIAIVRSDLESTAALHALQEAIHQADADLAVTAGTLDEQLRQYFAKPRFQTALLAFFASIALVLAAVGLYGLTSFLAAERDREVGVRIALGATRSNITVMMMREGMVWTASGLIAGTLVAAALMHLLRSLLFEVQPLDVRVYLATIALLGIVALAGTWLPSARAARMDPMEALRRD
ncbi:MAG: ABC transporter permease [Bryobacteraceae bacterium]